MTDIVELEKYIDEEISGYETMEKLYTDKREILIHGKSDELLNVDALILNTLKSVNNTVTKRVGVLSKLNIKKPNMSEIIKFLRQNEPSAVERFEEKKKQINELSKKISKLEKLNLELTKYGINMTNKTLEAILKSVSISTNEYDKRGKNIAGENLEMSSIVEEA